MDEKNAETVEKTETIAKEKKVDKKTSQKSSNSFVPVLLIALSFLILFGLMVGGSIYAYSYLKDMGGSGDIMDVFFPSDEDDSGIKNNSPYQIDTIYPSDKNAPKDSNTQDNPQVTPKATPTNAPYQGMPPSNGYPYYYEPPGTDTCNKVDHFLVPSDRCFTFKEYKELTNYTQSYDIAKMKRDSADKRMDFVCDGSEFFAASCSYAKSDKKNAEEDMEKYANMIESILN